MIHFEGAVQGEPDLLLRHACSRSRQGSLEDNAVGGVVVLDRRKEIGIDLVGYLSRYRPALSGYYPRRGKEGRPLLGRQVNAVLTDAEGPVGTEVSRPDMDLLRGRFFRAQARGSC